MSPPAQPLHEAPEKLPITPSAEVWRAMSPTAREDFIQAATEARKHRWRHDAEAAQQQAEAALLDSERRVAALEAELAALRAKLGL